jgi:hypothetical protein
MEAQDKKNQVILKCRWKNQYPAKGREEAEALTLPPRSVEPLAPRTEAMCLVQVASLLVLAVVPLAPRLRQEYRYLMRQCRH